MHFHREELEFEAAGQDFPQRRLLFHPDGHRLVVVGPRVEVRSLDRRAREQAFQFRVEFVFDDYVQETLGVLDASGAWLFLSDGKDTERRDLDGRLRGAYPGELRWLDPRGGRVVTYVQKRRRLEVWDVKKQALLARAAATTDREGAACIAGRALLAWGSWGRAGFELPSGAPLARARGEEAIDDVAGTRALATHAGETTVIDLRTGRVLLALPDLGSRAGAEWERVPPLAALVDGGSGVVAAHDDGVLRLWEVGAKRVRRSRALTAPLRPKPLPADPLVAREARLVALGDDHALAIPAEGEEGRPVVWSWRTGRVIELERGVSPTTVAVHAERGWLVCGTFRKLRVLDLRSGAIVLDAQVAGSNHVAVGPGGRVAAYDYASGTVFSPLATRRTAAQLRAGAKTRRPRGPELAAAWALLAAGLASIDHRPELVEELAIALESGQGVHFDELGVEPSKAPAAGVSLREAEVRFLREKAIANADALAAELRKLLGLRPLGR